MAQPIAGLSSRERILRTIAGEPVDRIPVFAPLPWNPLSPPPAPGDWKAQPNYTSLANLAARCCDFFVQLEVPERVPIRSARVGHSSSGIPEGIFDRRFLLSPPECVEHCGEEVRDGRHFVHYTVHTPGGPLTTVEAVLAGQDTVWEIEPLVKDVADAERLLSLPHRFDSPDMSGYFADRQRLGERGVTVCFISSPQVMVSRVTGLQRFLEWTITEPRLLERMLATAQERVAERLRYILEQGAGPIIRFGGSEQATPPMMPARLFDRFVLGYERPLWEMVRAAGRIVWVHCHGKVRTVIDKFRDSGAQLLDPVEPPPQGDIDIREAKARAAAGPMTLIGNVEWSALETCSPAEIERQVRHAVEQGGRRHFILGCSAEAISEVDDRLHDNIARFIEAGYTYGAFNGSSLEETE